MSGRSDTLLETCPPIKVIQFAQRAGYPAGISKNRSRCAKVVFKEAGLNRHLETHSLVKSFAQGSMTVPVIFLLSKRCWNVGVSRIKS